MLVARYNKKRGEYMAYCRFSTDDFQCDLYLYESCYGGYQAHIAARRPVYQGELPPQVPIEDTANWWNRHQQVLLLHQQAELVAIELPYAGESFGTETAAEMLARLHELRALGYSFPDYVLVALAADAADEELNGPRQPDMAFITGELADFDRQAD